MYPFFFPGMDKAAIQMKGSVKNYIIKYKLLILNIVVRKRTQEGGY
jgi:hypothetical protein